MSDLKKNPYKRFPQDYPDHPERFTEEIVAVDHIELADPDESLHMRAEAGETFSDCHRQPKKDWSQDAQSAHDASVRQDSDYNDKNKAAPDNNLFFEERSNPLSSKGN